METEPPTLTPDITGVVLTRNAQRLGEQCFSSLSFCSAILAVDSGSTDQTKDIAQQFGATFVFHPWQGFATQFTFAHTLVRTRWFFILDQDEICPPELAQRIQQAIARADALEQSTLSSGAALAPSAAAPVAFSVGRLSWYFDRFMRHGDWYPDYIPRIFRTGLVDFTQKAHIAYHPHGRLERINGAGSPAAEIIHYPYTGFSHQLEKLNVYAEQGASAIRAEGKSGSILRAVGHAAVRFLRVYFFKRGFLDGKAGFLLACHDSFYVFLKYVRPYDSRWGAPFDQK